MSRLVPWLVLALGLVVVVAIHRDFGPTTDEGVQATYGELALRYFASGGADTACNEYLNLRYYGPLVEMLPALFYDPAVGGKYEVRHLVLGLLSLLVIPGVWLYARISGLPGLPWFAVLAVVALPRFFGHWFNNSKDMPFALAVTWLLVALAWVVRDPGWRWRQVLACAATMGLGLCVRPGGFPILALFLLAAVAIGEIGARRVDPYRNRAAAHRSIVRIAARVALVPLLAWVVMVLPWPWAHQAPIANPIEAMRVATEFPTTMPVFFEGITWNSDELPWYYLPKYVLITTPLGVLLLCLAGLFSGLRLIVRERSSVPSCSIALTLVWLFAPLALFAIFTPNVYGGMRHFLFLWPAIAILAGHGAAAVWSAASPENRITTAVALSVMMLLPVRETVRLHPYQIAYYNALVGGVGGASAEYWTDYPMSSYREAIEWVNEQPAPTPGEPVRVVLAAGEPVMLWARDYAAVNVELVPLSALPPEERREGVADYFIGTTRLGTDATFPKAPIVHTIGRAGATFTVIRKLPR